MKILTKTHVIYLKWKLRTCRIQYQVGKVSFVSKKMKKLILKKSFQRGNPLVSERAKIFFSVKKTLNKKFQRWLSWDNSNGERNKVTNFGHASPTSMESTDKCMVPWSNWPIPAWNRLNVGAITVGLTDK